MGRDMLDEHQQKLNLPGACARRSYNCVDEES